MVDYLTTNKGRRKYAFNKGHTLDFSLQSIMTESFVRIKMPTDLVSVTKANASKVVPLARDHIGAPSLS